MSIPTQTASAIQLASAKRAILCELHVNGKVVFISLNPILANVSFFQHLRFPKYTSGAVNRVIERNAQEYTKLAKAFEARDWATVKAAEGKAEFIDVSPPFQVMVTS